MSKNVNNDVCMNPPITMLWKCFLVSIIIFFLREHLVLTKNAFHFHPQKFIGDYPEELFIDEAAKNAISSFQKKLRGISAEINERNAKLVVPYPYLLPERVPNSIAIWDHGKQSKYEPYLVKIPVTYSKKIRVFLIWKDLLPVLMFLFLNVTREYSR